MKQFNFGLVHVSSESIEIWTLILLKRYSKLDVEYDTLRNGALFSWKMNLLIYVLEIVLMQSRRTVLITLRLFK